GGRAGSGGGGGRSSAELGDAAPIHRSGRSASRDEDRRSERRGAGGWSERTLALIVNVAHREMFGLRMTTSSRENRLLTRGCLYDVMNVLAVVPTGNDPLPTAWLRDDRSALPLGDEHGTTSDRDPSTLRVGLLDRRLLLRHVVRDIGELRRVGLLDRRLLLRHVVRDIGE